MIRGDENDVQTNKCSVPGATSKISAGALNPLGGGGSVCPSPPECCPDPPRTIPWIVHQVAWFRTADNNPVVVDSQVVDQSTFSRNHTDLPSGSSFPASANRLVAEELGFPRTQSVMYSGIGSPTRFYALTADDVNMVKMGMTGQDRVAETADDYVVLLTYETDCTQADIRVDLGTLFVPVATPGACLAEVTLSFPQPAVAERHWSMTTAADPLIPGSDTWLLLELNDLFNWDFTVPILRSGFETGDTSEWTAAVSEP